MEVGPVYVGLKAESGFVQLQLAMWPWALGHGDRCYSRALFALRRPAARRAARNRGCLLWYTAPPRPSRTAAPCLHMLALSCCHIF